MYVQSDALLLADAFEKFQNMCLEIYELTPSRFLTASGLARKAALKKTEVKLDLLTDMDMLIMVETEEEYVMLFTNIQKLITNV